MLDRLSRLAGYGLCHQLPERSFFGGGLQLPVCSRDTGMYLGFTAAVLLLALLGGRRRPSRLPPMPVALAAAAFVAVMVADGVTSYAGLRPTTNGIRLTTGLLAGFAAGTYSWVLAVGTLLRRPGPDRVLGKPAEVAVWFAAVPASLAAIRWGMPLLGAGYPLLVVAAILFAFTVVNLVIVGVFRPFERSIERVRDLAAPVSIAFVLTAVEIAGSALVRLAFVRWVT